MYVYMYLNIKAVEPKHKFVDGNSELHYLLSSRRILPEKID